MYSVIDIFQIVSLGKEVFSLNVTFLVSKKKNGFLNANDARSAFTVNGLLLARKSKNVKLKAEVSPRPVHYMVCLSVLMHVL